MMKTIVTILASLLLCVSIHAQTVWTKDIVGSPVFSVVSPSVIDIGYARSAWAFGSSVMLLDINGDIMWQKKFPGSFIISDMVLTPDNDLLLVGFLSKMVGAVVRDVATLVKIDMQGDVLWTKQYESPDFSTGATCVQGDGSGNFVVGGWKSDDLGGVGNIQGLLLHVDNSGAITSSVIIEEATSISDVEWLESGNVIAVGSKDESVVGDYTASSISVFALDADNNFLWWKDYSMENSFSTGVGLDKASNGNILVFGESGNRDFALIEMDADGNTISTTRINQSSQMEAVQMEVNSEGIIHLAGNLKNISPQGDVYWRPMSLRILSNGDQEFAQYSLDNAYSTEFLGSICTFDDGTYGWLSQGQSNINFRKLDVVVVTNACPMLQPNLSYAYGDLLESEDLEVSVIPVAMMSSGGLNFAATNYVMNTLCSANMCDESVLVYSDGIVKCEGDTFIYQSLESFDIYNWYIDGSFVSNNAVDTVSFEDWGFYELKLEAYTANLCPATDILNLTVLPNPVVNFTVSDTVHLCQGENVIIATDVDYSIYSWNIGVATPSITIGVENQFWVDVTADNGCTAHSDTVNVFVHSYPNSSINFTGDTLFCSNTIVELSTQEYVWYDWSNGDTTQVIHVNQPGMYFALVSSEFGCLAYTDTINLDTLGVPHPSILSSGPLTWCTSSDSTVTLSANDSYFEVLWSNDVMDSSQVVDATGLFYYLATDSMGCSNFSDTLAVIEWLDPSVVVDGQTASLGDLCQGTVDLSVFVETPEFVVMWPDFPDENGLSLTDLCTGSYEVTITDSNGCQGSEIIVIDSGIGVDEWSQPDFLMYPNPTLEVLFYQTTSSIASARIIDMQGKVVKHLSINSARCDVRDLAPGTYSLQLVADDGALFSQTFVKK